MIPFKANQTSALCDAEQREPRRGNESLSVFPVPQILVGPHGFAEPCRGGDTGAAQVWLRLCRAVCLCGSLLVGQPSVAWPHIGGQVGAEPVCPRDGAPRVGADAYEHGLPLRRQRALVAIDLMRERDA